MTEPLDIPLQTRWVHPQDWYLCHLGADRAVIEEIVAVMETQYQTVKVQPEDGLAWSLPDFRASIRSALDSGETRFILLLNERFPGAAYKQTMGPLLRDCANEIQFDPVRIAPCDMGDMDELDFVDLVGVTGPARIREILILAPHYRQEIF